MTRLLSLIPRTNSFLPTRDLFDRFFEDMSLPSILDSEDSWVPAFDITENDKGYLVTAELPGMVNTVSLKPFGLVMGL